MSTLGQIASSIDTYNAHVTSEVHRARADAKFAAELRAKWKQITAEIRTTHSPTGTPLPRLALPQTDDPGVIANIYSVRVCRENSLSPTPPIANST